MKRFEVHAVCEMVFPNIEAASKDAAIAKVAEMIPATIQNGAKAVTCGITIDDISAKSFDLIDGSNNHDPKLVERINSAYNEKPKQFAKIVDLLAQRDIDEWDNPEFYAQQPREKCRVYCQHIADNKDLETILNYCRM